jgi:hypothetical protein
MAQFPSPENPALGTTGTKITRVANFTHPNAALLRFVIEKSAVPYSYLMTHEEGG